MPKRKALYNQYKLTSELHEVANQYMDVFEKHDTLFQPLAAPSIRILAALDLRGLTPVFNTEVEAKAIRVPITENHRAMIKSTNGPDVMKTIENSLIEQIIISTQRAINEGIEAGAKELHINAPVQAIKMLADDEGIAFVGYTAIEVK